MSEPSGCWVVYYNDMGDHFVTVYPQHREADALRHALHGHHECRFVPWGSEDRDEWRDTAPPTEP